jgi:hypothetical protein
MKKNATINGKATSERATTDEVRNRLGKCKCGKPGSKEGE